VYITMENYSEKRAGRVIQVVEGLASKHLAQSLNLSSVKKKSCHTAKP
jgi:hypothetical protein